MWIALSLVVCIVGLLIYCFVDAAKHPHAPALALHMFWVGLLAFLLLWHGAVSLGLGIK